MEGFKQELPREAEIALRIIGRNTALISPEEIHSGKGCLSSPRALDSRAEELLGDAPAGERHTLRAPFPIRPVEFIHPRFCCGLGQLRRLAERKQIVLLQSIKRVRTVAGCARRVLELSIDHPPRPVPNCRPG